MSKPVSLQLYFSAQPSPGLYQTKFILPTYPDPIVGMRGSLYSSFCHPFIWCNSCVALSIMFVSAVLAHARGQKPPAPLLEGDTTSAAGIIGKLLNKGVRSWLHDIFGSDATGRPLLHRMILCCNARGRLHGPVTVTLKSAFLPASNITIFMDNQEISQDVVALESLRLNLIEELAQRTNSRKRVYKANRAATACAA